MTLRAGSTTSNPTATRSSESSSDGGGQGRAVRRRGREDRPVVGNAIPRSQVPPFDGNIIIGGGYPYYSYYPYYPWYYPGYYPWGYGGIGFGFSYYSPGFYGSWYGPPYYGGGGYPYRYRPRVNPYYGNQPYSPYRFRGATVASTDFRDRR